MVNPETDFLILVDHRGSHEHSAGSSTMKISCHSVPQQAIQTIFLYFPSSLAAAVKKTIYMYMYS